MISIKESIDDRSFFFKVDLENNRLIIEAAKTSVMCHISLATDEPSRSFSESGCKPLTVFFESRFNAINKIPGGFKKKDLGSDQDIVISRLVDRCIRPLLPNDFNREIKLYIQVLNYREYSLEVLSVMAASILLNLFGIIDAPVSLCKISGEKINACSREDRKFKFFGAFSAGQNIVVDYERLMDLFLDGLDSYRNILDKAFKITSSVASDLNDLQSKVISKFNVEKISVKSVGFLDRMRAWKITRNLFNSLIQSDSDYFKHLKSMDSLSYKYDSDYVFNSYIRDLLYSRFVDYILRSKKRLDGRSLVELNNISLSDDVRETKLIRNLVSSEKGCNLFSRGKTQIVASIAIADSSNSQCIDSLEGKFSESLIVNYNFLSHLSDSNRKILGNSRREIGHSELIKKSLRSIYNPSDYAVSRIVCDVVACDGSSSMSSVCAASVLLYQNQMIDTLVGGISIGLIKHENKKEFLVDLNHFEDEFLSMMDCKIAGTKRVITAIQLDVKKIGLSYQDFNELLKISVVKLNEVLNNLECLIDSTPLGNKRAEKSVFKKSNDECNRSKKESSVHKKAESITLNIDTQSFKDCLDDRDIQIAWLAKKLRVDIRIEGARKLRLSAFNLNKIDDAIKYIKNLIKN